MFSWFTTYALQWTVDVLHMDPWHTTDGGRGQSEETVHEPFSNENTHMLDLDLDVTKNKFVQKMYAFTTDAKGFCSK